MATVDLGRNAVALVDDEDAEQLSRHHWYLTETRLKNGVARYAHSMMYTGGSRRRPVSMHRFLIGTVSGKLHIDHINGDGLDNRRSNLRVCTPRQNAENKQRYMRARRDAGAFVGVYQDKSSGLWVAEIHAGAEMPSGQRKKVSLKCWSTPDDAARAYDRAARHFFGNGAPLNFPGEVPAPYDPHERGTSNLTSEARAAISRAALAKVAKRGVEHHFAKLTPELVREIRSSSESSSSIATRLGLHKSTVQRARSGRFWKEVV